MATSQALQRIRQLLTLISDNGLLWTSTFASQRFLQRMAETLDVYLTNLETSRGLPGRTSVARNREKWTDYDWRGAGEEWNVSPEWKRALIDDVLVKYIDPGKDILEVGPGAGRWTEWLVKLARSVVAVDVSEKCIEMCEQRFKGCTNVRFFLNNGCGLPFLGDRSIDYI
jgi:2-polyprenyl-3-methyl-5-hydroxy-6-metoxy-1,4-benzoquinol methylase